MTEPIPFAASAPARPPAISVIMAARNGAEYIEEAVASILTQTLDDFEFIIVDDASAEPAASLLRRLARQDPRISLMVNPTPLGLAASLNRALDEAKGALIARFDADDVSAPRRLERQAAAYSEEPDLVLLGSNVAFFGETGALGLSDLPLGDGEIRFRALFENPFAHPAVMLRGGVVRDLSLRYDTGFETTQDWEFWTRLMRYGGVANLAEPLVQMRRHPGAVSARKRDAQRKNSLRIQIAQAKRLGVETLFAPHDFQAVNDVFLGDRRDAGRLGVDRARLCLDMMDRTAEILAKNPSLRDPGVWPWIVRRSLEVGVPPPFHFGSARLLARLVTGFPGLTARLAFRLIGRRLRGAGRKGRHAFEGRPGSC